MLGRQWQPVLLLSCVLEQVLLELDLNRVGVGPAHVHDLLDGQGTVGVLGEYRREVLAPHQNVEEDEALQPHLQLAHLLGVGDGVRHNGELL